MTSSNGNIFRVTGPMCGEFTGPGEFPAQRPVTRSFDVFFHLRLNKRLSKQPWGWWFETPGWSVWRHRNVWWQINALSYYSLDQMTSRTYSLFDEKLKLGYSDLPRSHSGCRLNALLVNTFKTEIISLKSEESVPSDGSFAEQHQPPNTKTQQPCSMLSFYFQSDTARNSPDDSGQEATEIVTKQLAMSEVCVIDIHRYVMFPHLHFNDKSTFYLTNRNWRPYK